MKLIDRYSNFVSTHPFWIVFAVFLFSVFMVMQFDNLRFANQDNADMLPDGVEVIENFEFISNEFGGQDTIQMLIRLDPSVVNSNQPRDIRSVEIFNYIDILSRTLNELDDVASVGSATSLIRQIDGVIPGSNEGIKKYNNFLVGNSISADYNTALININLEDNTDPFVIIPEINDIVDNIPKPSKISVEMTGERVIDVVMDGLFASDMGRTSNFALLGIFIVVLLIFRSFKYGLTPLTTIIFANLWAFGWLGLQNRPITSVMTGVSSMIMGIGIDFGIQVVYRYKYEMKTKKPSDAMTSTLSNVIVPMSTTTLAALIGFRAMSLGQLTMMEDIGTMMTYGVLFSMIAALTFVPAILVIGEKYKIKDLLRVLGGKIK